MERGEVWWGEMQSPIGRRPVVLIAKNYVYQVRNAVTVGLVTRTIRNIKAEVKLGQEDGLPDECVANFDDILTIPKTQLVSKISTLSEEKIKAVNKAIRFALHLD